MRIRTIPSRLKSGDAVNASAHATETKSYNDEGYTLSARNGAAPASITYQDAYSGDATVINIYYDQKMPTISFQIHKSWEDTEDSTLIPSRLRFTQMKLPWVL